MAVYEHTYTRYTGSSTPTWSRFAILPRYAFKDVFKSRLLVFFIALTMLFPLACAAAIYVQNNLEPLEALLGQNLGGFFDIDASFFWGFARVQLWQAFFLALFIGPGLVSRDLANNGLPLYLSRPISRAEYVLGKLTILLALLSVMTWIAGLGLFFLNGNLTGWSWMVENAHLAIGVLIGSGVWIVLLALLALALSAWVRWKMVAGILLLMIPFTGMLFSVMINQLFRTSWGHLLNPIRLIEIVTASLLGVRPPAGPPVLACYVTLGLLGAFCLLLLHLKIRAYRVVR